MNNTLENIVVGGGEVMNTTDVASLTSALGQEITAANMFSSLTPFVPIIGVIFVVSLSFYFLRRILKKGSHARTGM